MAAARIFRRLAELLDVTVATPADGEVLTYDSGTSKWKNEAAVGGSQTFQVATVTLDAAAVQGLGTTPVVVVEGVPGKLIVLLRIQVAVFQGAVAFDPGTAYLLISDETQVWTAFAGPFDDVLAAVAEDASGMYQVFPSSLGSAQGYAPATAITGQGLVAFTGDPMLAQGDGHIQFTTLYALADAPG